MSTEDRSDVGQNPYAGRWVALLHGKITAQGGTPEQALKAAQKSRFKEKPEILFFYMMYRPKIVSDQNIYTIHLNNGFMKINGKALKINGEPVRF